MLLMLVVLNEKPTFLSRQHRLEDIDNVPDITLLSSSKIKKYDQETCSKYLGRHQTVTSVNKLKTRTKLNKFAHGKTSRPHNCTMQIVAP
jgi:hypothetical protein